MITECPINRLQEHQVSINCISLSACKQICTNTNIGHFAKATSYFLITQSLRFSLYEFLMCFVHSQTPTSLHTQLVSLWLSVSGITRYHLMWSYIDIQTAHCRGLTLAHTFRRLNKAEPLFSTPRSVCFFISVSTSLNHPRLANHKGSPVCGKPMGCEVTECSSCTEALHQRRWHAGHSHPITAAPAACVSQPIIKHSRCVSLSANHLEALLGVESQAWPNGRSSWFIWDLKNCQITQNT